MTPMRAMVLRKVWTFLSVVLAVQFAESKWNGDRDSSSNMAEYGWHCYVDETAPDINVGLLTDLSPCVKVLSPADGYGYISSGDDHYRLEIDVAPRGNIDTTAPIEIEWFRVERENGESQEASMQECHNQLVCEAKLYPTDQRQTLFAFHVTVRYHGRDETASHDIFLENSSREQDYVANAAADSEAVRTLAPVPMTNRVPMEPIADIDLEDFLGGLPPARRNSGSLSDDQNTRALPRLDRKYGASVGDQRSYGEDIRLVDETQNRFDDQVSDIESRATASDPFDEELDLRRQARPGHLHARRKTIRGRGKARFEPGSDTEKDGPDLNRLSNEEYSLPHRRRKTGGHEAAALPDSRQLNPHQAGLSDGVPDGRDSDVDRGTLKLLDSIESFSEKLNQAMATPETAAAVQDVHELSQGLDSMKSNITKILNILSSEKKQKLATPQSKKAAGDGGKPVGITIPETEDSERADSVAEAGSSNATVLSQLGEMAHGLLHQSCRHLAKSYRHLKDLSEPQKVRLEETLKAAGRESPDDGSSDLNDKDVISPDNDEDQDADYPDAGSLVKASQRRLAGYQDDDDEEEVADDFLRMWKAVGLKKSKNKGSPSRHRDIEVSSGEKDKQPATDPSLDDFETAERFYPKRKSKTGVSSTTQSFDQMDVREDTAQATPTLTKGSKNPQKSNVKERNEPHGTGERANVRTKVMMIMTPEPGVYLRKDLVVIQPTSSTDENQHTPSPSPLSLSTAGRDSVQTAIMTILTPEPGILSRQDIVVLHPSTKPPDTQTASSDLKTPQNVFESTTPSEGQHVTKRVDFSDADSLLLGSIEGPTRSGQEPTLTGSDNEVALVDPLSDGSPVLYLEPFPQPKNQPATPRPPPAIMPVIVGTLETGKELDEYPQGADQLGAEERGTFPRPSIATRPIQPQFAQDYSELFPTEPPQNAEPVAQEDPQFLPSEFQDDQLALGGMDPYLPPVNYYRYAQTQRPHVEFQTEYDDTNVFDLRIDSGTTNPTPVIESQSADQADDIKDLVDFAPSGVTAASPFQNPFLSQLTTANIFDSYIDQVEHRLDLEQNAIPSIEALPEDGNEKAMDAEDSFQIYENPFNEAGHAPSHPTPKKAGERVRQGDNNQPHVDVHVSHQEQPPLADPGTRALEKKNAGRKLVNVSITGEIGEDNVKFLSEILDFLRSDQSAGKWANRWPFMPESGGNNLVIINREDRGIHLGDLESPSRHRNASSSSSPSFGQGQAKGRFGLLQKLSSDRLGQVPTTSPRRKRVKTAIEDEDGDRVDILYREGSEEYDGDDIDGIEDLRKDAITRNGDEGLDKIAKEIGSSDGISEDTATNYDIYEDATGVRSATMKHAKKTRGRTRRNSRDVDGSGRGEESNDLKTDELKAITGTRSEKPTLRLEERLRSGRGHRAERAAQAWSDWGLWSPCSVSCGKGAIIRQRTCQVTELELREELCPGSVEETAECVLDACLEEEKGEEVEQEEGHSTEVDCRYDTTQTPTEIYWMSPTGEKISKDSTAFSEKFKITGSKLIVRGVQGDDVGTYHCVVIMADGTSETADAKINVLTCTSNPCHNGGVCVEHDYGNGLMFTCECTVGYEGHTCDQVSAVFMGDMSMVIIGLCALVIVILAVVVYYMRNKQQQAQGPFSGTSDSVTVEMEAVSPAKPLLTDAEVDIFREISREEFKNFKQSNSYSLFKGKRESRSGPTIETEAIDRAGSDADRDRAEIDDGDDAAPVEKGRQTASFAGTPTKKSSSAESVSLPSSPVPTTEEVEQQRSTHIALSSPGRSGLEEILSMADYQESKPRRGSSSSGLLSSPRLVAPPAAVQQRASPLDISGKSRSASSASARSAASRARKSLTYAAQPVYRNSRYVVTYEEDRASLDAAQSHSGHRVRAGSAQLLERIRSVSTSDHSAPLIVKSSSGKLRAVRYEGREERAPSMVDSSAPLGSPARRGSSVLSSVSLKARRDQAEESNAWIPIEESLPSATVVSPSVSESHPQHSSKHRVAEASTGTSCQSIVNEETASSPAASMKTHSHLPSSDADAASSAVDVLDVDTRGSHHSDGRLERTPSTPGSSAPLRSTSPRGGSVLIPESVKTSRTQVGGSYASIPKSTTSAAVESAPTSETPTHVASSRSLIDGEKTTSSTASPKTSQHPSPDGVPVSASIVLDGSSVDSLHGPSQPGAHRVAQTESSVGSAERTSKNSQSKHSDVAVTRSESPLVPRVHPAKSVSFARSDTAVEPPKSRSENHSGSTVLKGASSPGICHAPLIVKSSSGNLRAVRPGSRHEHRAKTSRGSLAASGSAAGRTASIASTRSVTEESLAGDSSHEADGCSRVSIPTSGPTADAIDGPPHQTTHTGRPSKFGFPAYTRKLSLAADSLPHADAAAEPLSPLPSRDPSGASSSTVRQATSSAACPSLESRHSSHQCPLVTAQEIARVLSDHISSLGAEELTVSPTRSQPADFPTTSASDANQERAHDEVAVSSYHTALAALDVDSNNEVVSRCLETEDADGVAAVTSHHWQPLPEFEDAEVGMKTSPAEEQELNIGGHEQAATPARAASDMMSDDHGEVADDWRPLQFSTTSTVRDADVLSRDIACHDNPGNVQNVMDSVQSLDGRGVQTQHSDHGHEATSQQRRGSKFGYSGYAERLSHIVDGPTAPPTNQVAPSPAQIPSQSATDEDEDETDLPFDDALEGISDLGEGSDKNAE